MSDGGNTMDETERQRAGQIEEQYEPPELIDYGSLAELTLSGTAPLSEGFGGGGGGGGS